MSTPTGWQTPKTNWDSKDPVGISDLNRLEGNPLAIETGERTLDPAQAPTGNIGSLGQILSWFANRIRAILGTTNWWDAPPITLGSLFVRKITAGNGLTGGGDLSADRAIAMGTPSTITATTSNSVTSTSHTHALSGMSRIAEGSYTGNGVNGRMISVGFTPKCVILCEIRQNTHGVVLPQHISYPNIVSGGFLTSGSGPSRGNYDDYLYGWVAFA